LFSEGNGTTLGIGEARRNEVVQDYGNEVDKEVSFISQIQQYLCITFYVELLSLV
jgi:hypothetical protein